MLGIGADLAKGQNRIVEKPSFKFMKIYKLLWCKSKYFGPGFSAVILWTEVNYLKIIRLELIWR